LSGTFAPNHPDELRNALRLLGIEVDTDDAFMRAVRHYVLHRRLSDLAGMPAIARQVVPVITPPGTAFTHTDLVAHVGPHATDLQFTSASYGLSPGVQLDIRDKQHTVVRVEKPRPGMSTHVIVAPAVADNTTEPIHVRRRINMSHDTRFTLYPLNAQFRAPFVARAIADMLAREPKPTLVFIRHEVTRVAIERALHDRNLRTVAVHGDMDAARRLNNTHAFQNGDVDTAILSFEVAGVGINLQRAARVVIAELPWNVAAIEQAEHRAWRIGRTDPVDVKYMLCNVGLDAYLFSLIMLKIRALSVGIEPLQLPRALEVSLEEARRHGLVPEIDAVDDEDARAATRVISRYDEEKRAQTNADRSSSSSSSSSTTAADTQRATFPARRKPPTTPTIWLINVHQKRAEFRAKYARAFDESVDEYKEREELYLQRWNDYEIDLELWWDDFAPPPAAVMDKYNVDVMKRFRTFVDEQRKRGRTAASTERRTVSSKRPSSVSEGARHRVRVDDLEQRLRVVYGADHQAMDRDVARVMAVGVRRASAVRYLVDLRGDAARAIHAARIEVDTGALSDEDTLR